MNTYRCIRARHLRPQLSQRYRCLHRAQSSLAESTPAAIHSSPPSTSPPEEPNFFRRYRSVLLWSLIPVSLGFALGMQLTAFVAPPPMPEHGSHEDGVLMADLNARIDHDFKVSVLRGKCLGVARQLKGQEGGWVELVPAAKEEQERKVAGGPLISQLQGTKGLGVERMFWDRGQKQLVAVVWFGPALSGWPGVTHGGLLATTLTEKISLAATLAERAGSSSSTAAIPQRLPGTGDHAKMVAPSVDSEQPAELSLSYIKPTHANNFYVIRVSPVLFGEDRIAEGIRQPFTTGDGYEATLETMDARVCVKAQAKFAPSSRIERVEQKVVDGAKDSYDSFKKWMWPSRQQNSQLA